MQHGPALSQTVAVYIHFCIFLKSRVRVMNARSFKKRSVCYYRFFTLLVSKETTASDLFSVDVECEILEIILAEKVWVCINGA